MRSASARLRARKEVPVAAAEHADRRRAGVERAFVRRGVDAERKAGDDAAAGASELGRRTRAPGASRSGVAARVPTIATQGRLQALEAARAPQARGGRLEPPRRRTGCDPRDSNTGSSTTPLHARPEARKVPSRYSRGASGGIAPGPRE